MDDVEQRLRSLGIVLPSAMPPVVEGYLPAFEPWVAIGDHIHLSGRLAKHAGALLIGKLGDEITLEQGRDAARGVAVELLAVLKSALGDLGRVTRLVRLGVMVNCAPQFTDVHAVANGASEFLKEVLGERGRHARSVFGASQIPFGACLEIELLAATVPPKRRVPTHE